jgi:hypothetical protein
MSKSRYTVVTNRGAFIVYATTPEAARRQFTRRGLSVNAVRPRGYKHPRRSNG